MAQMASHTNLKVSVSSTFSLVFSAAKVDIKLPKHSKMLFSRSTTTTTTKHFIPKQVEVG
jgi:hypothetical protein